jgi:UDP-2-acetamido-3-amino-2,3-dideoxy-glucuronate N-acetyltransferase
MAATMRVREGRGVGSSPADRTAFISDRARVHETAHLGPGTRVWAGVTICDGAEIGADCIVGERAFIDAGVRIGSRCKIQNAALLYAPAVLEDGVFIGPGAILANDRYPRAITPQGEPARAGDWIPEGVVVRHGASIGAGAVVVAGVEIGAWALVAAGAVVNRPVPAHGLVAGVPARLIGWVGRSGRHLTQADDGTLLDPDSGEQFRMVAGTLENLA